MATNTIGRRELLLLLIGVDEEGVARGGVSGITRLQKLLFLLEQEGHIRPTAEGFEFEPYKAGPYSRRLYDDLELLENLGLVASDPAGESTAVESVDIDGLGFEDLIVEGDLAEQERVSMAADSFEERRFSLTDNGKKRIGKLLENKDLDGVTEGIRIVKGRFSHYSLRDLLRYVYERYPEMTAESEIIDQVLGRPKK